MPPGELGKMLFWASQPPLPGHTLSAVPDKFSMLTVWLEKKIKALLSHLAHFFLTGIRWIITRKPFEYFICKLNFCRNAVNPLNPKILSLICCPYNLVSYRVGNIIYRVLGNTSLTLWGCFTLLLFFKFIHIHYFVNSFWKARWGCYYLSFIIKIILMILQ